MKILIVDDHPIFLKGLSLVLEDGAREIELLVAENVTQALKQVSIESNIDIILTDLNMPGMDGSSLINMLQDKSVKTPVAVLSGTADVKEIRKALNSGAVGFIPKDYSGEQLFSAIDQILAGEYYLPREIGFQLDEFVTYQKNFKLSDRQTEILQLINKGLSNKQIAHELNITEPTVKTHISKLFQNLGVYNRIACINKAKELGFLSKVN